MVLLNVTSRILPVRVGLWPLVALLCCPGFILKPLGLYVLGTFLFVTQSPERRISQKRTMIEGDVCHAHSHE